jgi:beta-glucanase (GH16 family)
MLTITGSADNHGGAVSYKHDNNTRYHRWEARMRHYRTGGGGADDYHPVLLMWPDSENWPDDGEQDFSESNVGDSTFSIYIHYGGGQDAQEGNAVDLTQFNNYAVEWIPGHVRVYLNGTLIFDDTNGYVQTASPMHPTAQLDSGSGPGAPMNPCRMDVAWYRQYAV